MKTSAALLLAAGTCGAGFLAGWLVFHSDGTCKVDLPPTQPLQCSDPLPAVSDRSPELEKPDSRLVIQSASVEPSPSPAPVPQPMANAATTTPPASPDPRTLPDSTLEEMNVKLDAIQAIVSDLKRPIIKRRFKEGLFDHMSDDPDWSPPESDRDRSVISQLRSGRNGCDRTTLPRDQYPALYAYYDETLRLEDLIHETESRRGK